MPVAASISGVRKGIAAFGVPFGRMREAAISSLVSLKAPLDR